MVKQQQIERDGKMNKQASLAKYLNVKKSELVKSEYKHYGLTIFSLSDSEYLIGTEREVNKAVKEEIKESVWAFNPSFLSDFTGQDKKIFTGLSELCESSNDVILALIGKRFNEFVKEAVMFDGRGHFLSSYDGEENEIDNYYVYRTN